MSPEAIEIRGLVAALFAGLVGPAINEQTGKLFKGVGDVRTGLEPDTDLPALYVRAAREQMRPDGDLTAGEPSFVHELTLVFFIALSGNDRDKAQARLTTRIQVVLQRVLTDADLAREIEGFTGLDIDQDVQTQGERFYAAATVTVGIQFRTSWPTPIDDDFLSMAMTAKPLGSGEHTPAAALILDIPQE